MLGLVTRRPRGFKFSMRLWRFSTTSVIHWGPHFNIHFINQGAGYTNRILLTMWNQWTHASDS